MNRRIEPELYDQVTEILASGASPRMAAQRLHVDERIVRTIAGLAGARRRGRRKRPRPRRRKRPGEPPPDRGAR